MWMRIVKGAGVPAVMAGMMSLTPVSQGMAASSVVFSAAGCTNGFGPPPGNWSVDTFGVTDTSGEKGLFPLNMMCPIPTDPATKTLKVTVFYKVSSFVPPSWRFTGTTATVVLDCLVISQDRSSPDYLTSQGGHSQVSIGTRGESVGNVVVTLHQAHKQNSLRCLVPIGQRYLQTWITGYQVDQS